MGESKIVVIDGNSLINRAYYAIQRPMITKEGLYTHGVYGFLTMLQKIQNDYAPTHLLVAFDRKAPTFRHLEYTEYKAGRKKMPPELVMQMPLLKEVLSAMGIKILELDGFEADDIIGTAVKRAEAEGFDSLIITGDKDELQLASEKISVLITKKGISEFEIYDDKAMVEKYGFTPMQFIDYKGLMGDSSDNIPGIPGVGEKTAQKLILQFGSVEELIRRSAEIENEKLRVKVEDHAQLALMSKRLATIITEVPIEIDFSQCKLGESDYAALVKVYKKLEFNSFLKKLGDSHPSGVFPSSEVSHQSKDEVLFSDRPNAVLKTLTINCQEDFEALTAEKNQAVCMKVFHDHNHTGDPFLYGIALLIKDEFVYINTQKEGVTQGFLRWLTAHPVAFFGHQLQDDYYALMAAGFPETLFHTEFDTAIGQYLLEPTRSRYELQLLYLEYFNRELPSEKSFFESALQMEFLTDAADRYGEYGAKWCLAVADLRPVLKKKIEAEKLSRVLYEIELPLIVILAFMEYQGFAVDKEELLAAGSVIESQIDALVTRIYALSGEEFNINSPKQMGIILFEKLGLPGAKKTKTGYATGAEILERLAPEYEIAALILEYRTLSKLNSTYILGLLPLIDKKGKIHAHFQQTVTATGRISCTEPNLQNIPVRQELGRKLRRAFTAESDEYTLIGADYSQIELRVLAHMSGDETLIEAFNQGQDIHRITAARVFAVPEEDVSAAQRSSAKAVNFGVIYGISSFGLSTNLNISRKEAESYILEYFKKHTRVKEFMDEQVAEARKNGFVTTIMNRKRNIQEINASNYMVRQAGERLAMNTPIQGSAADIIKLAMIKVQNELIEYNLKSKLILQVHDELIIQAHKDELSQVKALLIKNMEQAVKLKVKLSVDLNTGDSWYALK